MELPQDKEEKRGGDAVLLREMLLWRNGGQVDFSKILPRSPDLRQGKEVMEQSGLAWDRRPWGQRQHPMWRGKRVQGWLRDLGEPGTHEENTAAPTPTALSRLKKTCKDANFSHINLKIYSNANHNPTLKFIWKNKWVKLAPFLKERA